MFHHILVGLDGSEGSKRALTQALNLAQQAQAEVTAVSVEERLPHYAASVGEVEEAKREKDAYFQKVHAEAHAEASSAGVRLRTVIQAGHAAATILRYAREGGFDLIALGAPSGGLGGTADKVVDQAPCSVLIVREAPLSMRVDEIMARDVAAVTSGTPVRDIVELLIQRGIKAVPVTDAEGRVIGIITGGDLIERGGLRHRLSLVTALDPQVVSEQLEALARGRQTAQDVMTPKPLTIPSGTPVSVAARWMTERRFKRLPVVDDAGRLVGIVSRLDVLRAVSKIEAGTTERTTEPTGRGRLVKEFMGTPVPSVALEASAAEVVAKLSASAYRRVAVVDARRRLLGLITDREVIEHLGLEAHASLLKRLAGRTGPLGEMTVRGQAKDMMITNVVTVSETASIMEALNLMMEHHVKRLPVLKEASEVVGIVDRDGVLRAVAGDR